MIRIGALMAAAVVRGAISLHLSRVLSGSKRMGDRTPGALLASTADMRGVHIAVDIMAKDIMATAAITARRRRQSHSPVRRRQSSNSRRIGRPATPTGMSAG